MFLQPAINLFVDELIIALHPFRESYALLPGSTTMRSIIGQYAKAPYPIEITALGIFTEVNPLQPSKALAPMETTEFGIIVFLQPAINSFVVVLIIALHSFRESYALLSASTTMRSNPEQPAKGHPPIEVTELGIVTEVRPMQPSKAERPIDVTELGILTELRPVQ